MEIWKTIEGLDGVEVSSLGRVRKILTQSKRPDGYLIVTVSDGKTFSKQFKVHRLIAAGFHGLNLDDPDSLACHLDDDPSNNISDNIFVGTHSDNMKDKFNKGRCSGPCKLNQEQVIQIRSMRKEGYSYKNIAKEFGVDPSTIGRICTGITW